VVPDSDKCVQLDFPLNKFNPNEQIEEFYLNLRLAKKVRQEPSSVIVVLLWAVAFAICIYVVGNILQCFLTKVLCRIC